MKDGLVSNNTGEDGASRQHTQHSNVHSRVLQGKNHEEHQKRTNDESVHLQHAHKSINNRIGKDVEPRPKKEENSHKNN